MISLIVDGKDGSGGILSVMEEKNAQKHLMRINEALYRVTDLLPDQEPVKWMARKKAMEALTLFTEDSPALFLASRMKKREEFAAAIHHLLDLLEFASHNTFISQINFDVLSREYRSFLQEVVSAQSAAYAEHDLLKDFYPLPKQKILKEVAPPIGGATSSMIEKEEKKEEELSTEERRKRIFSYIIQKEKGITMQELLEIFKGSVNQRTIQRDLIALIERGRVKTSGARRWRMYSVV